MPSPHSSLPIPTSRPNAVLLQFERSHFCKKARWALRHHGIEFGRINLHPGLHRLYPTVFLAPGNTLPILIDGFGHRARTVTQGSGNIMTRLDAQFPERSLTPTDPTLAQRALELEQRADDHLGVNARRLFYNAVIDHTDVVIDLLTQGASELLTPIYKSFLFPVIRIGMKQEMRINPTDVEISERKFQEALDEFEALRAGRPYFVGDRFSRVDLTVASLLGPFHWPQETPATSEWRQINQRYKDHPLVGWVKGIYDRHH